MPGRITPENKADDRCSFCSKERNQVERLTAGPGGLYICNECVDLYRESIEERAGVPITMSQLMRICNSCGIRCPASYHYCFNCGSQFPNEHILLQYVPKKTGMLAGMIAFLTTREK